MSHGPQLSQSGTTSPAMPPARSRPVHSQAPLLVHLLACAGEHHDCVVQASAGGGHQSKAGNLQLTVGLDGGQDRRSIRHWRPNPACTAPQLLLRLATHTASATAPTPPPLSAPLLGLDTAADGICLLNLAARHRTCSRVDMCEIEQECLEMHQAGRQGMAGKQQPAQVCSSPPSVRTRGQQVLQLVAPQAVARHHLRNEAVDARWPQ